MAHFKYTIFDGDPMVAGPCAWPSHEDVEVESDSPEDVLADALGEAESTGDTCGEYNTGDDLHVIVWDADGQVVAQGTHTVDTGDDTEDGDDEEAFGVTFADWLDAAGREDSTSEYDLRAAWRAGEDPAEYTQDSAEVAS
jgi:hypothetical protein